MTETIHRLIEQYGLIAVFLGCVAEGESAALLAGFFAHQRVFVPVSAFLAAFGGAFLGDVLFFLAGRLFATSGFVRDLRKRSGFSHALDLIAKHPAAYVILNRYVYGFRLIGGVAAGVSSLPVPLFIMLNAISSAIWAVLFCGAGYLLGAGAEQVVGEALAKYERLLIALGAGIAVALAAALAAHHFGRRRE